MFPSWTLLRVLGEFYCTLSSPMGIPESLKLSRVLLLHDSLRHMVRCEDLVFDVGTSNYESDLFAVNGAGTDRNVHQIFRQFFGRLEIYIW